jgi:hypothetical protein
MRKNIQSPDLPIMALSPEQVYHYTVIIWQFNALSHPTFQI